eukprot:CAMPEP_0168819464 /NCGR_PEP_ID=MMETSP0726-20121227/8311_1 /TAXON_ID=265536 /ORGANISM="Amphiprora sp., Strain CCMP467" /LENGTH=145 /DNA_ID=CAMNT_0008871873 /DNA_START=212 /DNA_END=646 /DNA_ORIENTATION=-
MVAVSSVRVYAGICIISKRFCASGDVVAPLGILEGSGCFEDLLVVLLVAARLAAAAGSRICSKLGGAIAPLKRPIKADVVQYRSKGVNGDSIISLTALVLAVLVSSPFSSAFSKTSISFWRASSHSLASVMHNRSSRFGIPRVKR